MCSQKVPYAYHVQLYEKYRETFEDYIKSTVSNTFNLTFGYHIHMYTIIKHLWMGKCHEFININSLSIVLKDHEHDALNSVSNYVIN
jgi:hypothetical protein